MSKQNFSICFFKVPNESTFATTAVGSRRSTYLRNVNSTLCLSFRALEYTKKDLSKEVNTRVEYEVMKLVHAVAFNGQLVLFAPR
eukprot:2810550-Amphidinium_carterae.1